MAETFLCSIAGCGKPMLNKCGYCNAHYLRKRRHGDPLAGGKLRKPIVGNCVVEGCDKVKETSDGYCSTHYQRWRKYGDPLEGAFKPRGLCKVAGCDKPHSSRGFCSGHLARFRRHGHYGFGGDLISSAPKGSLLDWIYGHVTHDADECLIWPFVRDNNGYGGVLYEGRDNRAHRVMCILAHGEAPSNECDAAHSCGNGHLGCVNPRHLRWATRSENQMDKVKHGTDCRGEKHAFAKLTEADVRFLRSKANTFSDKENGRRLGVHYMTIHHAITGKNWGWLE